MPEEIGDEELREAAETHGYDGEQVRNSRKLYRAEVKVASMSDWAHIEFMEIVRETDKAFLLLTEDYEEMWLPKSQIEGQGLDYKVGDRDGSMCITGWLAEQKGL